MFLNHDGSVRFVDSSLDPEPINLKSPRREFIDAYETIKRVTRANPDLKSLFQELLTDDGFKPAKRKSSPLPSDPEVIELSIWDNWLGDKPVAFAPNRYGVKIKAWTSDEVDFFDASDVDWSGSVKLQSSEVLRKELARKQKTKRKQTYPIGPEFAAMIEDACVMMDGDGTSGGLLMTKVHGEGTHCRDRQMLIVDTNAVLAGDVTASAVIWVDEMTPKLLPQWSTTDASGKPLPESFNKETGKHSKCVMQIRYARNPDKFRGWVSGRT